MSVFSGASSQVKQQYNLAFSEWLTYNVMTLTADFLKPFVAGCQETDRQELPSHMTIPA